MIERRRPLPAGRYWADVFPRNKQHWESYVAVMAQLEALGVEVSEHIEGVDGAPEHDFVIFVTNRELVWPDEDMGFSPNVAGPKIKSSDDTVQRPDPTPDALTHLNSIGAEVGKVVAVVAGVAVGVVVLAALATVAGKRRR